jgi:hypothetical protein
MLLFLAVLATPFVLVAYPPLGPLAVVLNVNLYLFRRRAAMLRRQRAQAKERAAARRQRELLAAARYFR